MPGTNSEMPRASASSIHAASSPIGRGGAYFNLLKYNGLARFVRDS